MTRICNCNGPECRDCRLYNDPRFIAWQEAKKNPAAKAATVKAAEKPQKVARRGQKVKGRKKPICSYRGEELHPSETRRLGLGLLRKYYPCGHPDKPLGEYVCPCKKCGSQCPGYTVPVQTVATGGG